MCWRITFACFQNKLISFGSLGRRLGRESSLWTIKIFNDWRLIVWKNEIYLFLRNRYSKSLYGLYLKRSADFKNEMIIEGSDITRNQKFVQTREGKSM